MIPGEAVAPVVFRAVFGVIGVGGGFQIAIVLWNLKKKIR